MRDKPSPFLRDRPYWEASSRSVLFRKRKRPKKSKQEQDYRLWESIAENLKLCLSDPPWNEACQKAHNDDIGRWRRLIAIVHLYLVMQVERQVSYRCRFYRDFSKRLGLVSAGNVALVVAANKYDPKRGTAFSTYAVHWIRKAIWREVRSNLSAGDRPDNIKFTRDVQLDHVCKDDDREIEIVVGRIPQRRTLCLTPSDDGDRPQGSNFAGMLSDGYASLINPGEATIEATHAVIEENETLSGRLDNLHAMLEAKSDQILDEREREIYRARYLFPARKTKLKELTDRYGLSEARISQIATEANKKVLAAIQPLADCYQSEVRFPTWLTIDDWCDHPKEHQDRSITEWRHGGDYNIDRVRVALDAGIASGDIGTVLNIPTTTTEDPEYNPAGHLVKLSEWRRTAAEQDQEQRERVERYLEHKALEQRVTLTTKGYRAATELNSKAKNGATASAREHISFAERAGSAA